MLRTAIVSSKAIAMDVMDPFDNNCIVGTLHLNTSVAMAMVAFGIAAVVEEAVRTFFKAVGCVVVKVITGKGYVRC